MSARPRGGVLLLSTYELGHPPHALAMMAGYLAKAGFSPTCVDLSVANLGRDAVRAADLIVFSTPMHTALRLALPLIDEVRALAPTSPIAFVGHYAALHRDLLNSKGVDRVLAGELEASVVELAAEVSRGKPADVPVISLRRQPQVVPSRRGLDDLSLYARFIDGDGTEHLAGYAETTRGCLERCRHCPVPAIYGGRFVAIDAEVVLSDIAAQVDAGADHITFGDPDFLNGPTHALRICRQLHQRWPTLTFDYTAQVANLLEHADAVRELVDLGSAFATTAVESLSDTVLEHLGKRHRRPDVDELVGIADQIGLTLRPTLVPFTPWTELDDIVALTEWIATRSLERHVSPVQMSVRLLVPPGSLLLDSHQDCFGPLDESALGHTWTHEDQRVDALAAELATLTSQRSDADDDDVDTHAAIRELVHRACGVPAAARNLRPRPRVPRVSEPWFC